MEPNAIVGSTGSNANEGDQADERMARAVEIVEREISFANDRQKSVDEGVVLSEHEDLAPELREVLQAARLIGSVLRHRANDSTDVVQHISTDAFVERAPRAAASELSPGKILLDRYRVIRLVGQGGMGQVYQADDFKLGQTVAIKFLPEWLIRDRLAVERFHAEVRIARSLAHPNVCRVYDLIEVDGQYFMTMEFIEGENLAQLIARVGCPTPEEAMRYARQLCSGLAEAHRQGVIHRDIKPSNVMVDKRGNVRIMDFGLAVEQLENEDGVRPAGTLEYMAPEQLRGNEPSVQSDLYSLGLVLYELFAGGRNVHHQSVLLRNLLQPATNIAPVELPSHVPAGIAIAIRGCLAAEPTKRPISATTLLASFPETDMSDFTKTVDMPQPELIAVAEMISPLSARFACVLFCVFLLGLAGTAVTAKYFRIFHRAGLTNSPEELQSTARQLLVDLNFPLHSGSNRGFGFAYASEKDHYNFATADRSIFFWYRQSPRSLMPSSFDVGRGFRPHVSPHDPALEDVGDVKIEYWPDGTLRTFECVPGNNCRLPYDETVAVMFELARLDQQNFEADQKDDDPFERTWNRVRGDGRESSVCTRQLSGQLAKFATVRKQEFVNSIGPQPEHAGVLDLSVPFVLLFAGLYGVRRNLRRGHADTLGAWRLVSITFLCSILSWLLFSNHQPLSSEVRILRLELANACLWSALTWILYVALEPLIRRNAPDKLLSWNRLVRGRFSDPVVGRDVLIGLTIAVVAVPLLSAVNDATRNLLGLHAVFSTPSFELYPLLNWWMVFPVLSHALPNAIYSGLAIMLLPELVRTVVRSRWLATLVVILFLTTANYLRFGDGTTWMFCYQLIWSCVFVGTTLLFGLVTGATAILTLHLIYYIPTTLDANSWYFPNSIAGLSLLLVLGVYSFWASLPQRSSTRKFRSGRNGADWIVDSIEPKG